MLRLHLVTIEFAGTVSMTNQGISTLLKGGLQSIVSLKYEMILMDYWLQDHVPQPYPKFYALNVCVLVTWHFYYVLDKILDFDLWSFDWRKTGDIAVEYILLNLPRNSYIFPIDESMKNNWEPGISGVIPQEFWKNIGTNLDVPYVWN